MRTPPKSLVITDLQAGVKGGAQILRGLSLTVRAGETHVIMGPNGGGKSTLAQVLMGHPGYEVLGGSIKLGRSDITGLPPDERARQGLFLGFQYPVEVAGVNFAKFLRQATAATSGEAAEPLAFRDGLKSISRSLGFRDELANRSLNEGFSGGEKKKAEIAQLRLLRPAFAVLDEPDSGLDVDALRYIADSINQLDYPIGLVLITHYQRILDYIKPDFVHVVVDGRIVRSGDHSVATQIDQSGYGQYA